MQGQEQVVKDEFLRRFGCRKGLLLPYGDRTREQEELYWDCEE